MTGLTTHFIEIPLSFAHEPSWPDHLEPPSIGYQRKPCSLRQRRFEGRDELIPQVDLGRYRTRAVLDWVQLRFFTFEPRQSLNIRNSVNAALHAHGLKENAFVTGPDGQTRYTGREFLLKLQDPTPQALALTLTTVRDKYRDWEEVQPVFFINAVEVSVDFYVKEAEAGSKPRRDLLRWQMVELLRRHLRVLPEYTEQHLARPRVFSGGGSPTRHIVADRPTNWRRGIIGPFAELGLPREASTVFHETAHYQPVVDGTYYVGPKDGPVLVRIMNKETDARDPSAGSFRDLPDEEKRARIEVTIFNRHDALGQGVPLDRFDRVDDLYTFEFQTLRPKVFEFFLPTIRPKGCDADLGLRGHVDEEKVFGQGGVYGLHQLHLAEHDLLRARRAHGLAEERPRPLARNGYLYSYKDLNQKVDGALRRLSEKWGERQELWEILDAGLYARR